MALNETAAGPRNRVPIVSLLLRCLTGLEQIPNTFARTAAGLQQQSSTVGEISGAPKTKMQDTRAMTMTTAIARHAKLALALALALLVTADSVRSDRCSPRPTLIFSGVTYGCEHLPRSEEGQGVLHWVRI